jgi:hypothetical protein
MDDDGNYHHRFDRDCQLPPMTKCPLCGHEFADGWFRPLYKVEPMTRQMMEITISQRFGRACSNCWGYAFYVEDVFVDNEDSEEAKHMYYVLCVDCKEETQGFVSPGYIGYSRRRDFEDYGNAILSLAPVIGLELEEPKKLERRSIETNLHELGF